MDCTSDVRLPQVDKDLILLVTDLVSRQAAYYPLKLIEKPNAP